MTFTDPVWMLALGALPPLIYFYLRRRRVPSIRFSSFNLLGEEHASFWIKARPVLLVLRVAAILALVLALMRPQEGVKETRIESEGVDIVLAVDVSGSMLAEDFVLNGTRQNRLDVVKSVVKDFVKKRTQDRLGLVVFAGGAYVQCPLTLDHGVLEEFLDRVQIGMIEDGTAVGDGLSTSVNSLRKIKSASQVVILLTDGVNNAGKVDPDTAARLAQAMKVRVYAIGAGSKGRVPYPTRDLFGNKVYQWAQIDVDDELLKRMAAETGGRYFRAVDTESLKNVYDEIDRIEKHKIDANLYSDYHERFIPFVWAALILVLLELVLSQTRLRALP